MKIFEETLLYSRQFKVKTNESLDIKKMKIDRKVLMSEEKSVNQVELFVR